MVLDSQTPPQNPEPHAGGADGLMELDPDHPGFTDHNYRRRRNEIAQLALDFQEGQPIPRVEYTAEEQAVWRSVWEHLEPKHQELACSEYLQCRKDLNFDYNQIPQLEDISKLIQEKTGFRMLPVAGLVSARQFLSFLGRDIFLSTQYIRHHSVPLYTPEPDLVHEFVGHAASLSHASYAELNRKFGAAAKRVSEEDLKRIESMYWFTVEFGACYEDGKIKAYGAGLLSSFGELGSFQENAELRPFNAEEIANTRYDPTDYQPVLWISESFESMCKTVGEWLDAQ